MYADSIYEVRKRFGGTYVTIFPDGLIIPWKALSLKDFISYQQDTFKNLIPYPQLEDEIFSKCVLDDSIIRQMPFLKAGIISTVVHNIWEYSGPTTAELFNNDLETARQMLQGTGIGGLHELVEMITLAFPYTPEQVYEMDYETFLLRTAQAEGKLLRMKIISSPFSLVQTQTEASKQKGPIPKETKPRVDAKSLWEEQRLKKKDPIPPGGMKKNEKWWKVSPVLETPAAHGIDFRIQQAEIDTFGSTGHEKADIHINRANLIKDAQWIYADVLKALAAKKTK